MSHPKDVEAKKEMCELIKRRSEVQQKLANLEKQIYNFETTYLEQSAEHGNVMRGFSKLFESTISGLANAATLTSLSNNNTKRRPPKRHFEESDRLFSLSSVTSPISQSINDGMPIEQDATLHNGLRKGSLTNGEKSTKIKEVNHSRGQRDQNCQSPATMDSANKDGEYGGSILSHSQHKRTRHI